MNGERNFKEMKQKTKLENNEKPKTIFGFEFSFHNFRLTPGFNILQHDTFD